MEQLPSILEGNVPMQPKLILHVINSLEVTGGAEQQLVANLQRFSDPRLRHAIAHLYSVNALTRHSDLPDDVPVHALRAVGASSGLRLSVVLLNKLVRELQPDLLHCSLAEAAVASRFVGRWRAIPVIESLVNISHEKVRCVDNPKVRPWKLKCHTMLDRMTVGSVSQFQALTNTVAESWQRVVGVPADRIEVIPRGIDIARLQSAANVGPARDELLQELGLPPETFLILALGRHEAQKGHRYVIEAMPSVLKQAPNAVLVIAGRFGNSTAAMQADMKSMGVADKVHLLGNRKDVPSLLSAADVFVFPSLFEGLGVALLEAMALQLPCIVSDLAPMNETVADEETGLLVEPKSPRKLAESILRLYSDHDFARDLGCKAAQHIEASFQLNVSAARVESMYLRQFGLEPLRQTAEPETKSMVSAGH